MKVDLPEVVFGWNYGVQQEHSVLEMTALHEVQKSVIKTDTLVDPGACSSMALVRLPSL